MKTLSHTPAQANHRYIYDLAPSGKAYYENVGLGDTEAPTNTTTKNKHLEEVKEQMKHDVQHILWTNTDPNGNIDAALKGDCSW